MLTESRTPQEIEREIENNRAELTENLETLQDKLSVDGFVRSIGDQLRDHGQDIGASVTRTVRENPAAVVLTGVGLAWMVFGGRSKNRAASDGNDRSRNRPAGHVPVDDRDHRQGHVAASRPDPAMKGGRSELPGWAQTEGGTDDGLSDRVADMAGSARDDTVRTGQAVSSRAANARSAVADAASGAASATGDLARGAKDRAVRVKDRIAEGTETLSEEARARVIAARQAALAARRNASAALSARADQASDLYDSHPLVMGALAVAVGAAIGGALPRSRKEDGLMGAKSDDLMREAERIFQEEREKARAVATAAKNEAQSVLKEKRDELDRKTPDVGTATDKVAEEAKSAGRRVAGAAARTADRKELGKVSS